jgi:uncharacterized protein (DUF1499 family)
MSRLWSLPSILVAGLAIAGPLGAFTGVLSPWAGFRLFLAGGAIALVSAIALGGAAAVGSLRGSPWRPRAVRAALVPVAATLLVFALQLRSGGPAQPFNDVTTSLEDPPAYTTGPAAGRGYPEEFVEWHRAEYPDLGPLRTDAAPAEAFSRALETARGMRAWEVVYQNPAEGVLEAVATSRIFRFNDDVAIRVRPDGGGSVVDVRSRSRVGLSDLGANAARIRAFFEAYRSAAGSPSGS